MRILLTGGSGTVGKEVLTLLTQKADFEIIVFDVDTKKSRAVYKNYHDKITVIYGDITQVESVEKACKLIDVVIHLAAIIPPLADENPTLAHEVNVIGTDEIPHPWLVVHSIEQDLLVIHQLCIVLLEDLECGFHVAE